MNGKIITEHSKFWLGDKYAPKAGPMDLWKLAAYRRAIANFVFILTGKNIPVRFAEKETSFTDGKVVYIGGELSAGEFDPTVGLSLHEAMHIAKSDFNLIKLLWGKVPQTLVDAAKGKFTTDELGKLAKYVLNVVEDRYIDAWAYESAPGYRGYYQALYNRYFYLPEIDEALQSSDYRDPTIQNYKFRFTNIINPNSDIDALPGLRKINEMLNLENILRPDMSSPEQRLTLAFAITEEIVRNVVQDKDDTKNKNRNECDESGEESGEQNESELSDDTQGESSDQNQSDENGESKDEKEQSTDESGDRESSEQPEEKKESSKTLSENEIKRVDSLIEKQEQFISREVKQSAFDSKTLEKLKVLEKNDVNIVSVGGEEGIPVTNCIVVKNLSRELMEADEFPYVVKGYRGKNPLGEHGVEDGIALGRVLGRRLQIRNEARMTRFNRLPAGKIDKRLIFSLGYEGENVFYQTTVDKYKNIHLHVSVDASGSMCEKWRKTMATVVAMAKAASMINNISVSISFRSGCSPDGASEVPYILIAYDSRKDNFNKIVQLFPYLFPRGSTPEGLAFQAILDNIPEGTYETDSYFVNLSDGEPTFAGMYVGQAAARHTKKQVNKIREAGVSVLSYFIETTHSSEKKHDSRRIFREMYGKDAQFVDVNNVAQIAHTMNKKFLSKES